MAATTAVRYSTSKVDAQAPANRFTWEEPVPVNAFWDTIDYRHCRSFIRNFTEEEFQQLSVDLNNHGTSSNNEKLTLLLHLLEEKATTIGDELYRRDYKAWDSLYRGIFMMQEQLQLPEAEETARVLVAKGPDQAIGPLDVLASHLVNIGKYQEAEEPARRVLASMESKSDVRMDSPQALHARRTVAKALWGQGATKRNEAEAVVAEIHSLVYGMTGGKFAVYQDEERELAKEMVANMD